MNIGIHIEANIISCLFCWLLFDQQRRHKVFDFLGTTAFNSLLWASIFIMILDSICWFMMADILPHTERHLMFVKSLYYIVQAILPMYFMAYCYNTSGRRIHPISWPIIYAAIVFTFLVLVNNFTTGFAFYVQDNYIYRSHGYWMVVLAPILYVSTAMILCTFFFLRNLRSTAEKRKISFHMFICVALMCLGAFACTIVNDISPWHIFIAALIYLYMRLHGYRERNLDILAYTDSLTGLKNHAMYTILKDQMDQRIRTEKNLHFAVAVMDVNYLKQLNDTHGHAVGNDLIINAARLICTNFDHSPVCRIGGDEFVAILEGADYENREALYRRFTETTKTATFFSEDQEFPLSIALGIGEFIPSRHKSFEQVFHVADEAMYQNKSLIKNGSITT